MARHKLDNYISLQQKTEDYSTGDLVVTNTTTLSFWGSIMEMNSPAVNENIYTQGRLRDKRTIKIIARYYDTESVDVGGELTFDDFDGTYTVYDKYDVDFKHYVCIMAERTV